MSRLHRTESPSSGVPMTKGKMESSQVSKERMTDDVDDDDEDNNDHDEYCST